MTFCVYTYFCSLDIKFYKIFRIKHIMKLTWKQNLLDTKSKSSGSGLKRSQRIKKKTKLIWILFLHQMIKTTQ